RSVCLVGIRDAHRSPGVSCPPLRPHGPEHPPAYRRRREGRTRRAHLVQERPRFMTPKKGAHLYFLGIGGTGMAAVAGLCQEAGFKVTGSDAGVYPPMSTMLEELGIRVKAPYDANNLEGDVPDLVVVANVLSRGNPELEAVLAKGT